MAATVSCLAFMAVVISISGASSSWSAAAPYPVNDSILSCAPYQSNLYCVGGASDLTDLNATYVYNSTLNEWSNSTPYPTLDEGTSCVTYNGYIYCVGGGPDDDEPLDFSYYARINSTSIGPWMQTTGYPYNVSYSNCNEYSGYIYCIGGYGTSVNGSYYAKLGAGGIGTWTETQQYPLQPIFYTCNIYSGYVYCVGGYHNGIATNASYYAPIISEGGGVGQWRQTTPYPFNVTADACVTRGNRMYCVGGFNSGNYTESSDVYEANLSSSGIGGWNLAGRYPYAVDTESCGLLNSTMYCVGGALLNGSILSAVMERQLPAPATVPDGNAASQELFLLALLIGAAALVANSKTYISRLS